MNEDNPYLPHVQFEAIPINQLVSNQEYQRALSEANIKRAVKDYDPYQINPVKVSRRDGVNYVINGQHTVEIVAQVSGSRETPVWCMVYDDLQYKREANIFANQQKYVKTLTPYEIFVANIEAQNDKQLLIKQLVESYELKITPGIRESGICAVGSLEYVYDHYGYEVLSRTLRLIVSTWEGQALSLGASVIKGLAKVLYVYGTDLKDEIFIDKLSEVPIKEIIRSAKEWGGGMTGYAQALLVAYSKKMRNPLPMDLLFSKKRINKQEREENDA